MDFFKKFSNKPSPKEVAKDRLKLILIHDRGDLPHETLEKIKSVELEMQVILGMAQIEINDVLDLKPDDVIKLDQRLDKELIACVNKKEKFYVAPGMNKNKICVKIVGQRLVKE